VTTTRRIPMVFEQDMNFHLRQLPAKKSDPIKGAGQGKAAPRRVR
jgi:hypothetical protein